MAHRILALLAALLILVITACDSVDSIPIQERNVGRPNPVFALGVDDPGRLHNEIVKAYAARRPFGERATTRVEFVRTVVAASNEAFAAEGLPPVVTGRDVEQVLAMIHELREEGVFDFFSKTGDPLAIIDYWESKGVVSASDAAAIRARLESVNNVSDQPVLVEGYESEAVRAFDSIYAASKDLWSNRLAYKNLKSTGTRPSLLTRQETMYELDAIGTIFGWFLGGPAGGTFGAMVFSIAFIEVPPDGGGGWDCSDYCNMG